MHQGTPWVDVRGGLFGLVGHLEVSTIPNPLATAGHLGSRDKQGQWAAQVHQVPHSRVEGRLVAERDIQGSLVGHQGVQLVARDNLQACFAVEGASQSPEVA